MKTPIPPKTRRKLGQNFLTDANVLDKIVQFIDPMPQDHIVEIGAGTGALSMRIAPLVKKFTAIELDASLLPYLEEIPNIAVVHEDILKTDIMALASVNAVRIIGNLPYYISSAVLSRLIEQREAIQDMVLMFQEEVAERIISRPSHHEYGFLSVMAQYFCEIETGFRISRNCFYPKPQIESRVLRFQFRETRFGYSEYTGFLSHAFSQRRKKLRNNLLRSLPVTPEQLDAAFRELFIAEEARAENLTPAEYEQLLALLRT